MIFIAVSSFSPPSFFTHAVRAVEDARPYERHALRFFMHAVRAVGDARPYAFFHTRHAGGQ
jgi:hypothetical protein